MKKIVLATTNQGKANEFQAMVKEFGWEVLSLKDFPEIPEIEETGRTFQENARIKALAVAGATGLVTVADDSGLEVDYLGGAPGIYSARFAGEPKDDIRNYQKLLFLLGDIPEEQRKARFRCTIAIADREKEVFICDGVCEGVITGEPAGCGGFGYDPVFWLPQFQKTMAELSMEEKNSISHRGKAFRAALPILEKVLGQGE